MKLKILIPLLSVLAFSGGCVSKTKYKKQVTMYNTLQRKFTSLEQQQESLKKQLDLKKLDLKRLKKELVDVMNKLNFLNSKLAGEKGKTSELESKLSNTAKELTALQKAKREAEERARTQKRLMDQFKSLIKAGSLAIINRNGRLIIKLKAAILFPSGRVRLKSQGKKALADIAKVLAKIHGRHFQIAGHTDSDKVSSKKYKDNWLLSAYRAVNVLRYLQRKGVPGKMLSAAGYAQYQPLKDNTTPENKRMNRRIEIQIVPQIPSFLNE